MAGRVWQLVKQGDEPDVTLFGIEICRRDWGGGHRQADVIHPITGKLVSAPVYKIIVNGDILQTFAALHLGGKSWAFYL